jgi:hypothetical protein
MARLIDADALLEENCGDCSPQQREMCKGDPVCGLAMWIVEAPTVDAVPVVHGRWINTGDSYEDEHCRYNYWECSACGNQIAGRYGLHRYCPDCGAHMDLEGDRS